MSTGVPAIPASLLTPAGPALEQFLSIWRRVLSWDAAAGLSPLPGPRTVLAVTDAGLRMMTPCDVSDPFMVDEQLQRTLLRRHVLTEPVPPGDGRFSSGGRVARLDGGEVALSRVDGKPAFCCADALPAVGRQVSGEGDDVMVYAVDTPFVDCGEISDAIGRHPQSNPFMPYEPEPEPEPEPTQ